ncbi:MAG: hypothetical protein JO033_04765 [Acidobacteriaceae bacterium]|nr:hypothetical protein [Acidobacteriaceae bacterium]
MRHRCKAFVIFPRPQLPDVLVDMTKLRAMWGSLPHPVQALIIAFASAAASTFAHAWSEHMCFTRECLKHYAAISISAGVVAARAFYMMPNRSQAAAPVVPAVAPAPIANAN